MRVAVAATAARRRPLLRQPPAASQPHAWRARSPRRGLQLHGWGSANLPAKWRLASTVRRLPRQRHRAAAQQPSPPVRMTRATGKASKKRACLASTGAARAALVACSPQHALLAPGPAPLPRRLLAVKADAHCCRVRRPAMGSLPQFRQAGGVVLEWLGGWTRTGAVVAQGRTPLQCCWRDSRVHGTRPPDPPAAAPAHAALARPRRFR